MSWQALALVKEMPRSLVDATEKFVLFVLAYHHNDDSGLCSPSINTISRETNFSRSTVIAALKSLEERQFLGVERSTDERGNNVNKYDLLFLNPDHLVVLADSPSSPGLPEQKENIELVATDTLPESVDDLWERGMQGRKPFANLNTGEILERRPPRKPPSVSPELAAVLDHWAFLDFGRISQSAQSKLGTMVREYGVELTKNALSNAAEFKAKWPVSWAGSVISGLKRQQPARAPTRTESKYDHLIRR